MLHAKRGKSEYFPILGRKIAPKENSHFTPAFPGGKYELSAQVGEKDCNLFQMDNVLCMGFKMPTPWFALAIAQISVAKYG